ncbi:hypothetical protein PI125_g23219 [Phytophthora idaei]|nr:hypothetical protein PI125_g23219 [Phytophthora idaei]
MGDEDIDVLLVMTDTFLQQGKELREVRREVYDSLVDEAWRIAMRCRHYLTVQCMDSPSDSARMMLYRPAFHQLLHRFTEFYTIPSLNSRGRPAKLRYHHRILGLVLSFYVESMEQSTLWTLFGAPPSTFSRTLRRAEEALSKALNGYAPVRISWLAKLIESREPFLTHTFDFINGKNLKVAPCVLVTCW